MPFTVLWSDEASKTFEGIVTFIFEEWGILAAQKFESRVIEILELLKFRPYSFQSIDQFPSYKKILVSKQTYLFYEIDGDNVVLTYFWNNAKNPDDLPSVFRGE